MSLEAVLITTLLLVTAPSVCHCLRTDASVHPPLGAVPPSLLPLSQPPTLIPYPKLQDATRHHEASHESLELSYDESFPQLSSSPPLSSSEN